VISASGGRDRQRSALPSKRRIRHDATVLEMRSTCERCEAALPASSGDARICSYECTFCATCTDGPLGGRCPNCGGDLQVRPQRAEG